MKTFLMFRDRDFDPEAPPPPNAADLVQDLELETLFAAMAGRDRFLLDIARKGVLLSLTDPDAIRYRQDVLRDCLRNADVVRRIYQGIVDADANRKRFWRGIFANSPTGILNEAIDLLQLYMTFLDELRHITADHAADFTSEGFTRFFAMIREELDDAYFAEVQEHLRALKFREGVLLSLALGSGNEGTGVVLRKPHPNGDKWIDRLRAMKPRSYSFRIHPRDEHGYRAAGELRDRGVNLVANALGQSAAHIESFLNMLRAELAFYLGGVNLAERLTELTASFAIPVPLAPQERDFTGCGLYDVCLALTLGHAIVGNETDAGGANLVVITGANQGGKSTFLRSVGLAQVMMQCGLFVPAEALTANTCTGLFTHYKREEDATMQSGKLDEELGRMSAIVNWLRPDSLVLFNESFAATNEREGAEIGRQIVSALLEKRVKLYFVTHNYALADGFAVSHADDSLFLRAERREDGERTFKLIPAPPLRTSFGEDLYREVFGVGDYSASPPTTRYIFSAEGARDAHASGR